MKRALANNLRSSNNEVSRFINKYSPEQRLQSRRYPDVCYNGGVREYEDAADYVDVRAITRGRVIA
ncbi:hypothetical protein [Paenibacillus sp. FSL R5-0519]|uniref:hypothetical protein n=1 Tax=Paenibacillus sp. FSL R5-0519 TaxID=2921648 RepID=UPI0030D8E7EF